jgi:glycosyltransferase involved in cell wall biosynthesis
MLRFQIVSRLPGLHIFASNKDAKESLKEWLTPAYWETVGLGYSPIDPTQIAEVASTELDIRELRDQHRIGQEEFVVLAVGQFIDRKGRWIFLEAAKQVTETASNVRFVWLMPELISGEDKKRVESYGLGDKFVPVLSSSLGVARESILGFFRIADAFALPSFVEGLPIALIEAMALQLPSISTNVYAIPEAIIPDQTGILIEAGDSDALARSILRLKDDPNLRERLATQGSCFALENFDGRIMAAAYLERYRQCFE